MHEFFAFLVADLGKDEYDILIIDFDFCSWVANHYKWIVWKFACYERGYPAKTAGKYLTVSNVLEELKYR